jgi:hypothetical protein
MPHPHYPYDTPSGPTTPWHERAPLFAHECLGPNEGVEVESPVAYDSPHSPIKPRPDEEVIDMSDPTLERFPEDRMSILTHIRSTESRMSEDETSFNGVPPDLKASHQFLIHQVPQDLMHNHHRHLVLLLRSIMSQKATLVVFPVRLTRCQSR